MRSRHMEHRGFVFRWGGEEFLLVYEQMNCDETAACLRELLTEMEQVGTLADGEESGLQWRLAW